jgi:hypothetical protein
MRSKTATPETFDDLVALAKAAAAEAADYQERYAAEDTESRKIVDIMERFLRDRGRVVYGGAAINAHLSPAHKFYDPALYLPDYDFMTPDPIQDCADLIATFEQEGFVDVEAKFGIHEGTYKIFVNYRSAADITFMPPEIYSRVIQDADTIDGIRYASVNFLRMNMYLELSRPAGDVKRWEKVFERLLLLNAEHPLRPGRCTATPLAALGIPTRKESAAADRHDRLVGAGIAAGAVFLSGAAALVGREPRSDEVVLMMSDRREALVADLKGQGLTATEFPALGELLPARTEVRWSAKDTEPAAVVFDTVACHSYVTLPAPAGYRLGSLDLLIQMYYAMYFTNLQGYLPVRLLCVIQELIELEAERRRDAVVAGEPAHDVFPLECLGHQPTMPELKKAHRARVTAKRRELMRALKPESGVRPRRRQSRSRRNKRSTSQL